MYYPIGWPKIIDVVGLNDATIRQICCDRVKILFAILTDDSLAIYYTNVNTTSLLLRIQTCERLCVCNLQHTNRYSFAFIIVSNKQRVMTFVIMNSVFIFIRTQPCVPIVITRRTPDSIAKHGTNCFVEWKPDSNMLVVAVSSMGSSAQSTKINF